MHITIKFTITIIGYFFKTWKTIKFVKNFRTVHGSQSFHEVKFFIDVHTIESVHCALQYIGQRGGFL
jgi:hypothetical protein